MRKPNPWEPSTWLPVPGRPLVCRFTDCGKVSADEAHRLCPAHRLALAPATPSRGRKPRRQRAATNEPMPPQDVPSAPLIEALEARAQARHVSTEQLIGAGHGTVASEVRAARSTGRINAITADRVCVDVLCLHPLAVWGDDWWWWWIDQPAEDAGAPAA